MKPFIDTDNAKLGLLGVYLRELRVAANLSSREAAQKMGLKNTHLITQWESGTVLPSIQFSQQIARTYFVSEQEVREILDLAHELLTEQQE